MKLYSSRTWPIAVLVCLPLLAVSSLLSGCANMVATAPSVPIKTQIGGIKGLVHGGRGPVIGANVYLYSPSLTGYGGSGIAASTLNASTPLLNNSVPSTCGVGATATATADPVSGAITSITVTTGGAGYFINGVATPPIVTITDPTGTGATATANLGTTPNGSGTPTSGWVQNFTITNAGTGYTAPVVTITPASTNPCQDANGNYYVNSDQNGNFALSGDYTCTAGLPVYAYTIGGDTGGGAAGDDGFMAVLGICPASGNFATTLPYVNINELTTVAAAYALAGFATNPTHIGVLVQTSAAASRQALETTGLSNAFLTAGNLYNVALQQSSSPTTTPNGNGALPYQELNTLADILANCVNSVYVNYTCEKLLSYTPGQTDTAGAAIYIAQHPTANVANIFALATANGSPWQPMLTAAPNDWTVCIIYTGGGMITPTYTDESDTLAIDASGNIWNANYSTTASTLSEFTNLGVPVTSTGYAVNNGASSVAIDINGNAWTANYAAGNLNKVTPSGTVTTVSPTGLSGANSLAFDGSGNMFIAAYTSAGSSIIMKATSTGTYTSQTTSGQEGLLFPYSVAIGPGSAGAVRVANGASKYSSYFTNALASTSEFNLGSSNDNQDSAAVDASGNTWIGVAPSAVNGFLEKITTASVGTKYTPGSSNYYIQDYNGLAVDGGNNIWSADSDCGVLYEVSGTGTTLSPKFGFIVTGNSGYVSGSPPTTLAAEPQSLAVDGSGNVWYDMVTDATVREVIGAAVPTITPLVYATANSLYGQKP